MTEERCAAVVERSEDGPCETCGHDDKHNWPNEGRIFCVAQDCICVVRFGRPLRLCGHDRETHEVEIAYDAEENSLATCFICDSIHDFLPALPCEMCGGNNLRLVRVGYAYEHFDQSDYDTAPCDAGCILGQVVKEEARSG